MVTQIKNPIIEGADPFILCHEGKYYHYASSSSDGFEVHTSTDLINWKNEGYCLKKGEGVMGDESFWAPEVVFYNNKFYMIYTANLHLAVASSESPLGPFKCERQEWLTETPAIDGSFFIDDDGKIYLYYVPFVGEETIWGAPMEDMYTLCEDKAKQLLRVCEQIPWETDNGDRIMEGPCMLKHKGTYYLFYSCNDFRNPNYAAGYAVSNSPLGTFEKYSGNPILKSHDNFIGTGHHNFTITQDGEILIVYHVHNSKTEIHPRMTCIDKAEFVSNDLENVPDILKVGVCV